MQIHVVQSGESLWAISQKYGISFQEIVEANQLPDASFLVVGQALVIPIYGRYYFVQPGDSLWAIGQRFGLSWQEVARINGLRPPYALHVGMRLYIPKKTTEPTVEVNAYIEPGEAVSSGEREVVRKAAPYLTYLAPFSSRVNRDGTLTLPPLDEFPEIGRQHGVTTMLVVSNLEGGQFSRELGRLFLNNEALANKLIDNIIATARRYNLNDVHFDFEFLAPEDREKYNAFLRRAAARIKGEGFLFSTALAPKTSATQKGEWYEAHDYKVHGEVADFSVLMTYEWGYSGGPPMPVSPIGPVRKVLEYALTEMPANKIMMGQNLYGYDWTLPYKPGGKYAKAISPQAAIALARKENVAIEYDEKAQAPFFHYWDDAGKEHVVWFEDARSLQAKFDLMKELGVRGISYWKLGLPFPQNWLLLEDNFRIKKNWR
ncbi:MAG TPA: glycoside hydrolase family 18 protein [Bacilli bacterium]|nr:glycoside hydrolase family 18 protein [Bacilli bacterium]